jgi:hypothetical protein
MYTFVFFFGLLLVFSSNPGVQHHIIDQWDMRWRHQNGLDENRVLFEILPAPLRQVCCQQPADFLSDIFSNINCVYFCLCRLYPSRLCRFPFLLFGFYKNRDLINIILPVFHFLLMLP